MRCTVGEDTSGNYYRALMADIVREKVIQAAFKKVYQQFHYFSVTLNYNGIQVFPDRQFISSHVLGLKRFHFSASTKLGITEQYNYTHLIILKQSPLVPQKTVKVNGSDGTGVFPKFKN